MCAYVTEDKYKLENERIRNLEGQYQLFVNPRGINQFIVKCAKYPLFNALNPTMMIICNQLWMLMRSENVTDRKQFFQRFIPDIRAIFNGRNVKEETILQDIIVYISHLIIIERQFAETQTYDTEIASDDEYDDGVYNDDLEYDDGNDFE